jgi:ankyrin repeat protein
VAAGQAHVVEVLLDSGARVNSQARGNVTALHVAAAAGDLHMVRTLIAAGADASMKTGGADGVDAASVALSGPQPATADRHAIAELLDSLSGAPRRRQRAAEGDDDQEL